MIINVAQFVEIINICVYDIKQHSTRQYGNENGSKMQNWEWDDCTAVVILKTIAIICRVKMPRIDMSVIALHTCFILCSSNSLLCV